MSGIAQVTDVANAFSTTLTAGISATDTTITVDSTGDLTAPCYLIIEPLSGTKREVVLCDSNVTATTFVLSGVSKRGLDAPAVSHLAGAKVISGPVAQHIDDLNARVDDVDRHLTVGATEPPTPQTGDLWVDTTAVGGTYTGDFDFTGDVDIQGTLGNVAAVSGDVPSHDGTSFKPKSLAELDLLTETAANDAYQQVIKPEAHGAVGDGTTDDATALNDAMDAAAVISAALGSDAAAVVALSPGKTYAIGSPIINKAGIVSEGGEAKILALAGMAGQTMMLDMNGVGVRKLMRNVVWDAANITGLRHFGSSSTYGTGGSSRGVYDRVGFRNSASGVYSVDNPQAASSETGFLTGSKWINPHWEGCSRWMRAAGSCDDLEVEGARFHMDSNPTTRPLQVKGANQHFRRTYLFLKNMTPSDSVHAVIEVGEQPVVFDGVFPEANVNVADGGCNVTEIFWASGGCNLDLRNVYLNMEDAKATSFRAVVSAPAGVSGVAKEIRASGVSFRSVTTPKPLIRSYVTDSPTDVLRLSFDRIDDCSSLILWADDGTLTGVPETGLAFLTGQYLGRTYGHAVRPDKTEVRPYGFSDDLPMRTLYQRVTNSSGASPQTATYTLPKEGMYEVAVVCKLNSGDKNHMAMGRWTVGYYDGINDLLATSQIGSSQFTTGSSFNPNSLTLSAPTSAGVVTATVGWTGGSNTVARFEFTVRRVATTSDLWAT